MTKARITITAVVEFAQRSEFYAKGATPEDMLAIDLAIAEDDVVEFMLMHDADWKITGEVIP